MSFVFSDLPFFISAARFGVTWRGAIPTLPRPTGSARGDSARGDSDPGPSPKNVVNPKVMDCLWKSESARGPGDRVPSDAPEPLPNSGRRQIAIWRGRWRRQLLHLLQLIEIRSIWLFRISKQNITHNAKQYTYQRRIQTCFQYQFVSSVDTLLCSDHHRDVACKRSQLLL